MKKPLSIILIILAIALIAYNVTEVNFENLLEGDSIIALICIIASLCAIALLMIYMTSKKIQNEVKKN